MIRRLAGIAALLVTLATVDGAAHAAASAAAPAASRVVLLRAPNEDALAQQGTTLLVAELRAAGFEVVEATRDPGHDLRADIEAASARLQPVATFAIRAVPEGAAAELWLEDRVTRKLVIRRIEVGAGPEAAANLALKAVELLRGSLLEVTLDRGVDRGGGEGAGASPPPAPPADVARFVADAAPVRRRYWNQGFAIAAGVSMLAGLDVGPAYAPLLRLSWGGRRGVGVRIGASGLGTAPMVRAPEGTGRLHQTVVLAEAIVALRPGARLQPILGAGAGAYHLRGKGTGASPLFPGETATDTASLFAVTGGVAVRLADRLSVILDAGLLLAYPRTRLVIAAAEAARAGGPALHASLTLSGAF